jgi:hypothetical protein
MSWGIISALMTKIWRIERGAWLPILFAVLAACGTAPAPMTRTTVDGVVMSEGLTMPGVRVTISGQGQEPSSVLTDNEGHYTFTVLAPATYDLEAELPGFEPLHRRIRVTEPVSIELQLALPASQGH